MDRQCLMKFSRPANRETGTIASIMKWLMHYELDADIDSR